MDDPIDYASSGLDIQYAKVDHHERHPDKATRPEHILWGGHLIKTADWWDVPTKGIVRIELGEAKLGMENGVDLKIESGGVELIDGTHHSLLRTWKDDRFEDALEYQYESRTGRLCVYNVYKIHYPNGEVREEYLTGNAGFWVDKVSPLRRIYHCSHGAAPRPDFDAFEFSVSVKAR